MTDPKAIDRSLDSVDEEIESLKEKAKMGSVEEQRLQRLYARRYELQKRQFKALQKKIARMKK